MTTNNNSRNLQKWQEEVSDIVQNRGWTRDWLKMHFLFMEEVGELTSAIRNVQKFHTEVDSTDNEKKAKENIKEEFADVLMYLFDLANYFEVDLDQALRDKISINQDREWS